MVGHQGKGVQPIADQDQDELDNEELDDGDDDVDDDVDDEREDELDDEDDDVDDDDVDGADVDAVRELREPEDRQPPHRCAATAGPLQGTHIHGGCSCQDDHNGGGGLLARIPIFQTLRKGIR